MRAASGVAEGLPQADAIYVNAAASHPVRAWLDALKPGGRLLFPLQAANSSGAMCLITRPAERGEAWPAKIFGGVVFIECEGAQDGEIGRRLDAAFRRGGAERVRWLRFGPARRRGRVASGRRLGADDGRRVPSRGDVYTVNSDTESHGGNRKCLL